MRRSRLLVEPPLPVLAGVLAIARAYLGGDSGVSHLAAAVGGARGDPVPRRDARRVGAVEPDRAARVDGPARRRRRARGGRARRSYFCFATIMSLILS